MWKAALSTAFKGKFGTLMWPNGTLILPFKPLFFLSFVFFAKIPFRLCSYSAK